MKRIERKNDSLVYFTLFSFSSVKKRCDESFMFCYLLLSHCSCHIKHIHTYEPYTFSLYTLAMTCCLGKEEENGERMKRRMTRHDPYVSRFRSSFLIFYFFLTSSYNVHPSLSLLITFFFFHSTLTMESLYP